MQFLRIFLLQYDKIQKGKSYMTLNGIWTKYR
jgi:hypothetical protein